MFVDPAPINALVQSEYGIGAYIGRFPDAPAERGWTAAKLSGSDSRA